MRKIWNKINSLPREFFLFMLAVSFAAFSQGIMDSTLNNFLNESFQISDMQRAITEGPREFPGFLVAFVSALLFFLGSRRLGFVANLIAGTGVLLIGLLSMNFPVTLIWLFIFSLGQHIFMPISSSIGMDLAKEGQTGKRLGQINGAMNFASIGGFLFVLLIFRFFKLGFQTTFVIAGLVLFVSAVFLFQMKPDKPIPGNLRLKLRKEYSLYYWLSILFGTRKQIFLTFAPWVLVSVFHQKTEMIAALLFVGGIIGIVFKPLLGQAIDKFGERAVLMGEAVTLIFVCLGYALSGILFRENTAFLVAGGCYIADQLLMAANMARATYLKKIAIVPDDVAPTLGMSVSIDHIFSIAIALCGGLLWNAFGYQSVFFCGVIIAVINLISASFIQVKKAE